MALCFGLGRIWHDVQNIAGLRLYQSGRSDEGDIARRVTGRAAGAAGTKGDLIYPLDYSLILENSHAASTPALLSMKITSPNAQTSALWLRLTKTRRRAVRAQSNSDSNAKSTLYDRSNFQCTSHQTQGPLVVTNTLYDALLAPHANNAAVFLTCDDGSQVSYAEFVGRVAQLAHVLTRAGVKPGDRVVVQAPKLTDAVALYGATVQTGAVYLPLNTAYTQSELRYFIADATPTLVVCDAANEAEVSEICPGGTQVMTLAKDGGGSLPVLANDKPTRFETTARGPDDLAGLLYTSGTTGRSKGAMMSHKNLLSNAQTLTDMWRITSQDRLIHALPIFHTHGLFVALNTALLAGAEVRFMTGFDIDKIIAEIPASTLLMGVPTFYTRLLDDVRLNRMLTKNMRLFISGSAPLLAETHTAFEDRTGHRILERYGMTETNMITSNPYDGARLAGTVGYALPGTEVVITANDKPIAAGEIGMIEVRGDNVFQGYWKMPEKTAEELRENGFFITGDLGVKEADGRISIVGRQKDLIISGGYNIYPKEIEDVINAIDGVLESAVFGVSHADFGESVMAAVVLEDPKISTEDFAATVTSKLAPFKHPRRYIVMQALPRNAMGKVQKNVLREAYAT
jgi:malonyl-CoA/methylmalonyl-CoA synthetase